MEIKKFAIINFHKQCQPKNFPTALAPPISLTRPTNKNIARKHNLWLWESDCVANLFLIVDGLSCCHDITRQLLLQVASTVRSQENFFIAIGTVACIRRDKSCLLICGGILGASFYYQN
jgi:hypothetical protein